MIMTTFPASRVVSEEETSALLSITLDRTSKSSLSRQLYVQLRALILAGRIPADCRLPSTRRLADDLGVSRAVTINVFEQLAAEGFLANRRGSGHYVHRLPALKQRTEGRAELVSASPARQDDKGALGGLPLAPGRQAVEIFPNRAWARMLARGWRKHGPDSHAASWAGLPALRDAMTDHLYALRGIRCSSDQIVITSGNSDALQLIGRSLARQRRERLRFWVENPGFAGSRRVLSREGIEIVPVPVDREGLCVEEGRRLAPEAHCAVVTPARQLPLGMPMSLARRLSLLEWARGQRAFIIEDDYDSEIRFSGRPIESLASLSADANVLSLGSFSRLMFPGLRLGYIVGAPDIIARIVETRREEEVPVPISAQVGLAEFISEGELVKHLRTLRAFLTRRRNLVAARLSRDAADVVEILPQEVGMHLTVVMRRPGSDVEIARHAREAGLMLQPLSLRYVDPTQGQNGFEVGYAGWSDEALDAALDHFIALLR